MKSIWETIGLEVGQFLAAVIGAALTSMAGGNNFSEWLALWKTGKYVEGIIAGSVGVINMVIGTTVSVYVTPVLLAWWKIDNGQGYFFLVGVFGLALFRGFLKIAFRFETEPLKVAASIKKLINPGSNLDDDETAAE